MAAQGVQYVLPAGVDIRAASDMLAAHLVLEGDRARSAEWTFYDTFDGRLHAAGLVLVHRDGRLALADGADYVERAAVDRDDLPDRILVAELPAGSLRDLLEPIVEVRALTPIACVRNRMRAVRVLDGDAKTVVRLVVAIPAVAGSRTRLRPRLHVLGVRGYDKALARARGTLERDLGLVAAAEPLHDEAVRAAGGTPGGTPAKLDLALAPEQRADSAAAAVLTRLLQVIEANVPGALADVDSEFLHDLRVAVRRSRSVQRQLAHAFPPAPLERMRAEFRWLQQVTGPARDLDVYVLDFDRFRAMLPDAFAADLEPLFGVLFARRRTAHGRMRRALRSARARAVLADWADLLAGLVEAPEIDRPDGARPIGDVAGERISTVYRRMVERGGAIDDASPPEALHDLRKLGKELRYLLELFGGLYPDKVVAPMVKSLKALQDTLGRFQDREVQAAMLRSLRDDVAALEGGAGALMAMGLLVERLEDEQAAARSDFAQRFAAFAASPQRALVKETFG